MSCCNKCNGLGALNSPHLESWHLAARCTECKGTGEVQRDPKQVGDIGDDTIERVKCGTCKCSQTNIGNKFCCVKCGSAYYLIVLDIIKRKGEHRVINNN